MNKVKVKCVLALFSVYLLSSPALAANWELQLKGMKASQVRALVGQPDNREITGDSSSTWNYGKSMIFFRDKVVVAWSDSGDLQSRANLALIRDTRKSDFHVFSKRWKNMWTPREELSQKEVLRELLRKVTQARQDQQ